MKWSVRRRKLQHEAAECKAAEREAEEDGDRAAASKKAGEECLLSLSSLLYLK